MKSLIFGSFLAVLSFASLASANSGTFCNGQNIVEFVCNQTPVGPGWVPQADGCFHRDTGRSCDNVGRPDPGPGRPGRPNPPPPPGRPNPPPPPGRPGPGPGYPGYPGRGEVVCSASDRGWEEHSAHRSCQECLRYHGRCIETCSIVNYTCEAQGYDYRGNPVRFIGEGRDRREAQDQAFRNCNYNARSCQVMNCQTREQQTSRRECR